MGKNTALWGCLLFAFWVLTGCSAPPLPSPTLTALPSSTQTPISLPTATATVIPTTPTVEPETRRTQYILQTTLTYPDGLLAVSEGVLYTNRSSDTLTELVMSVEANQNTNEFEWLPAPCLENGQPCQAPTMEGVSMTLPLNQALLPGQSVDLRLSYQIHLPSRAGLLSFGSKQVNLSGWIVGIVPYIEGQGWLHHAPGAVGEYQVNELADYDVKLRIVNAPEDLKIAASAPLKDNSEGYHFVANNVRSFALSASSDYEILESSVGSTRVRAFVFPEHLEAGFAALEAASKALELYSTLFGPYDRPGLTLVEAAFADGMENDGLFFLGQEYFAAYTSGSENYLTALSAHETAHQWWYAMTSSDQALEPWLDEALSTFSERLFYESVHPDEVDWWLQTRINGYQPQGDVNSTIYDFSAFRPYVNAVYLRGAMFLGELRDRMGEEAFNAFLQDYFSTLNDKSTEDQLGLSSADTFWQVLSAHYEGDISDLRTKYFK